MSESICGFQDAVQGLFRSASRVVDLVSAGRHDSLPGTTEASVSAPDCDGDDKSSSAASDALALVPDFKVIVDKLPGDLLGAGLGNTDKGAVVCNLHEGGLLDGWNKANPQQLVRPGFIITEVNGVMGYWDILDEFRKPGALNMKVSGTPPENSGPNWFKEIEEMGRKFQSQGGKSSFMLRLQSRDPGAHKINNFCSFPTVRASECGIDQCAICIEDVGPDDQLVQLPCNHAFHGSCAARWLMQSGKHAQGKRQCCPLCCRKVFGTAAGGLDTSDQ
jgi:hypothetical protein